MQKDKDGKLKYCAVRIVNFGSNPIIAAFPNPAHSSLTITGMGAIDRAELLDLSGIFLLVLTVAGNSAGKLNIGMLAAPSLYRTHRSWHHCKKRVSLIL